MGGGGRRKKSLLWDSGNQYCESLDDITRAGALWLFLGFLALMLRRTRLQLLLALERSPASATKIPFVLGGLGQGFVKFGLLQNPKALDKRFLCDEARWHLLMTCNLRLEMLMCEVFQRVAFTLVPIRILHSDWLCVFNGQLYLFDSWDLRMVEVSDDYFLMLASQRETREKGLNSWSAKMLE